MFDHSKRSLMPNHLPIDRKLFERELRGNVGPSSVRGLYGSRTWVDSLDITNELYGHRGCVNALRYALSEQNCLIIVTLSCCLG